jgi:hypothetical protein
MPAGYEKMRDKFAERGDKDPKGEAARIWNANHPKGPFVTGHGEKPAKKRIGVKRSK